MLEQVPCRIDGVDVAELQRVRAGDALCRQVIPRRSCGRTLPNEPLTHTTRSLTGLTAMSNAFVPLA